MSDTKSVACRIVTIPQTDSGFCPSRLVIGRRLSVGRAASRWLGTHVFERLPVGGMNSRRVVPLFLNEKCPLPTKTKNKTKTSSY